MCKNAIVTESALLHSDLGNKGALGRYLRERQVAIDAGVFISVGKKEPPLAAQDRDGAGELGRVDGVAASAFPRRFGSFIKDRRLSACRRRRWFLAAPPGLGQAGLPPA